MRSRAPLPLGKARRLGEEDRGLQGVEPAVSPQLGVNIGLGGAVRSQPSNARGEVLVARHQRARVAPGPEVLRREEAEAACVADAAARASGLVAGADRLRRVLDAGPGPRAPRSRAAARAARSGRRDEPGGSLERAAPRRRPRSSASSTVRALAFIVSASTSQNTGRAPAAAIASAAATNDHAGVTTASPGPMPSARSAELERVGPRRHAHRVRHLARAARAIARTPRRARRGRTAPHARPRPMAARTSAATAASCDARSTSGTRVTTCDEAARGARSARGPGTRNRARRRRTPPLPSTGPRPPPTDRR